MLKWMTKLQTSKPGLAFWLKWFGLFLLLFITLGLAALHNLISQESNPFFYANF